MAEKRRRIYTEGLFTPKTRVFSAAEIMLPHLNVWGFDISAAEFPQPKKTRVFGVNRPLGP